MKWLTAEEFAELCRKGSVEEVGCRFAGTADVTDIADESRVIPYRFSDATVGRDGFTIAQDGWVLEPFLSNPVFLWAHLDDLPPIGRVADILYINGNLCGSVEYMTADLNPFAETIFRMVKGKFLNAVSTRWLPRSWKYATDKTRPGAIDFTKQELLEVSQVPVPGLATALVQARSAGIDTGPMVTVAEMMLDRAGMAILPKPELEALRRAAKMPLPKRKVPAAPATPPAAPPAGEEAPKAAETAASTPVAPDTAPQAPQPERRGALKRGMYDVAQLAYLLSELGYIQASVEWEAAYEEDGSPVPAQLAANLKALGETLIALTIEEVTELVTDPDDDGDTVEIIAQKASIRKMFRQAVLAIPEQHRAGRMLSSANEAILRTAHENMGAAVSAVASLLAQIDTADPQDAEGDGTAGTVTVVMPEPEQQSVGRGRRERIARAAKEAAEAQPK